MYAGEVRRHIAAKLSCDEDIEDLVQEVFLRAHCALLRQPVARPRAYLHRIAASTLADHFRRSRRRRSPPSDLAAIDDAAGIANAEPTPEELAICEEIWTSLRAAIDRLPVRARQAIILRKLEDRSCAEVARSMRISVKTVEKHIGRDLTNLRATTEA